MKNSPTKKILIFVAGIAVVFLGLHYMAYAIIQGSGATVAILENEVDALQAQVVEFSRYTPEDLSNLAKSVNDRFIPRDDFVQFIESVENEARARNLAVFVRGVEVEKRSEDENDDKEIVRLKMETRGSWADNMHFVNFLEHLPYKVSLVGLNMAVAVGDDGVPAGTQTRTTSSQTLAGADKYWRSEIELTALKFK